MAIVTISRGCFSHGKQIAEKVAQNLQYECISREILIDASRFFHIPEMELLRSLHNAPSTLEKITHGKERYLAYIQAALLERVKKDDVVYHGHGGHVLLSGITHALKVRVMATMEQRVAFLREKRNLSKSKALSFLQNEDKQRVQWARYLYKIDINDPQRYDMVINVGRLTVQDACEIICAQREVMPIRRPLNPERPLETWPWPLT